MPKPAKNLFACSQNTLVLARSPIRRLPVCRINFVGPLIYSVSEDPVAAARVLNDFAKG